MSEIDMNEYRFYGSGGAQTAPPIGDGIGSIWEKLTLLKRNQEKILSRLDQLENVRDAKSEPESLPIGHSLSKEQISDKLLFNKQREIKELKTKIADKHKLILKMMDERDQYKNKLVLKEKDLEESSREHHRLNDLINTIQRENKDLKESINHQKTTITFLQNLNLARVAKINELEEKIKELEKENYLQKGMITDYKDQIKQWESMNGEYTNFRYTVKEQASTILELEKNLEYWKKLVNVTEENRQIQISELETANKYWENLVEKLQKENADLKWRFDNPALVEQQAARECVEIVTRIKNEPLTTVSTHREWMVAICEDIEKEIKKEFNLK